MPSHPILLCFQFTGNTSKILASATITAAAESESFHCYFTPSETGSKTRVVNSWGILPQVIHCCCWANKCPDAFICINLSDVQLVPKQKPSQWMKLLSEDCQPHHRLGPSSSSAMCDERFPKQLLWIYHLSSRITIGIWVLVSVFHNKANTSVYLQDLASVLVDFLQEGNILFKSFRYWFPLQEPVCPKSL